MPPRSRKRTRAALDPNAVRYFVYRCVDADERVLYVGRSNDPERRLRDHALAGATWVGDVASVESWGPLTWGDAGGRARGRGEGS